MSNSPKGRYRSLSPARRMVLEFLHHAKKVPSIPLCMQMCVRDLAEARMAGANVSWTSIFMKAYGLVAQRRAELRTCFMPFPWAHFYEHPISECVVIVERQLDDEYALLGGKVRAAEAQSLADITASVTRLRTAPVESISEFRQWLRLGRMPGPLRSLLFWFGLNSSGFRRARRFGTFAISSLGNLGVEQCHSITPLTTYLSFGPIAPTGEVTVRIVYDHRVMDGRCVARCFNDLEETLNTLILDELEKMVAQPAELAA